MALLDYNIDTSGSPQDVQRRQAYADALLKQGADFSPVQSPWQGAARLAQGLLGGYERGQAQSEEQQGRAAYQQRLASALQGGNGNVSPQAMIQLAGDPWANPAQTQAITHVADMQRQAARDAISDKHWAASYELQKRAADRADDPTPAGFVRDDNGTMHPIPGGPADPSYLRSVATSKTDPNAVHVLGQNGELYKLDEKGNPVIVHKNETNAEATLDDKTTEAMADQYLAGDRTVMQNLGRGAQGAANIVKLRQTIQRRAEEAGIDPKGIVNNFNEQAGALAGQRAVGTRAANISLAANEANNMIPIALAASDKLPRSQYMPWNKMVQAYQTGTSSPELASFVAATNSLVNSYVRAVSPSGVPTDSMREHAYSMLNSAQGPEAYKAVIATMQQEMKAALEAPSQVKKELRGGNEAPKQNSPVKIDGYTITEH